MAAIWFCSDVVENRIAFGLSGVCGLFLCVCIKHCLDDVMDSHCRLAERPSSRTAGSPLRNKSGVHCVVRLPIRVRVDRV